MLSPSPPEPSLQADPLLAWLLAEVRDTDPASPGYGSFAHGYAADGGRMGQYTEITGYGVSLLSYLHRCTGDAALLAAAQDAAAFLLRIQDDSGAYPEREDPAVPEGRRVAFDTAMCLMGVLDLWRLTGDPALLASAERAGAWLLTMQRPDGAFVAAEGGDGQRLATGNFFGDGSCIHVKNAMALLRLADALGDGGGARYAKAAARVSDYALTLQAPGGYFWAMPARTFVFTHAHCYACEGLLTGYAFTGDARYETAARRGVAWLARVQRPTGGVRQVYQGRNGIRERVRHLLRAPRPADATAQGARLFALTDDRDAYARALRFLARQVDAPEGGLYYTATRFGPDRRRLAWPAMFAVQARFMNRYDPVYSDLF